MRMLIKNECGPCYYLLLLPYMAYPNDETMREQFGQVVVANFAKHLAEDKPVTLERDTINGVLDAAMSGAAKGLDGAAIPGQMAGEVLLYMLRMRESGAPNPSLDKAQYLTGEFYVRSTKYGGGKYGGAGRDTVRKNWEAFRPVAHLWAAFTAVAHSFDTDPNLDHRMADSWNEIIIPLAQALYNDAAAYTPPGAKEAVLVPERTWKLDGIPPRPYRLPPLSETELQLLQDFVPRHRGKIISPVDKPSMSF